MTQVSQIRMRNAHTMGAHHHDEWRNCQDFSASARIHNGLGLGVVMDGVGSSPHADFVSKAMTPKMVDECEDLLTNGISENDIRIMVQANYPVDTIRDLQENVNLSNVDIPLFIRMKEAIRGLVVWRKPKDETKWILDHMMSTILILIAQPDSATVLYVGNGIIVVDEKAHLLGETSEGKTMSIVNLISGFGRIDIGDWNRIGIGSDGVSHDVMNRLFGLKRSRAVQTTLNTVAWYESSESQNDDMSVVIAEKIGGE